MKLWLLDEGTPGHTVQTEGVGKIFAQRCGADISRVSCRLKLAGWKRWWTRRRVGRATPEQALQIAKALYPGLQIPTSGRPELIISSCGKSAYLNRLLAKRFGARSIFIGELKPFSPDWFDLIITPAGEGLQNEMIIPVIESGRTPESARRDAEGFWNAGPPEKCWTILVGGESRSHRFCDEDWRNLAQGINRLAERHGIRWLLTTSRRTGIAAEAILRSEIEEKHLAMAVWWAEEPQKVVGAFLGAGERIFVTQDSLTMISEAILAGKRPVVVRPADCKLSAKGFDTRYLLRLANDEFFTQIKIEEMLTYDSSEDAELSIYVARENFVRGLINWASDEMLIAK